MFFKKHILIIIIFFNFSLSFSQNIAPVASNVSAATLKNTNASIHLVAMLQPRTIGELKPQTE